MKQPKSQPIQVYLVSDFRSVVELGFANVVVNTALRQRYAYMHLLQDKYMMR